MIARPRWGCGCLVTLTGLAVVLTFPSCGGRNTGYDVGLARAHVDMLAGTIGSRPVGSPANARARQYIVDELTQAGFAVRLQETDAVYEDAGLTARIANVIALREGARPDAVALVSHYDSVPEAAGALDDAIGVATCLEAARVLASGKLNHSLFVLVTDGEEVGLMGARAIVTDAAVKARLRAFLNFDGTGAAGPSLLFETGPGWGAALSAWAQGATRPAGASFATEIYKRLPNDTDFTILKTTGAVGLNFAPVGDAYAYHTDRDVADRVRSATLRDSGDNAVAIVRALDGAAPASRADPATFFDVAGTRGVVYGTAAAAGVAWVASLCGALAWVLLTRDGWRARGVLGLVVTAGWSALTAIAAVGAMIAAAWALRATRAELNPYYASPHWFFAWIVAAGVSAAALVGAVSSRVPGRARPWRAPAAIWWVTLPVWAGLTAILQLTAPTASYMAALPLVAASVLVLIGRRLESALRVVSLLAWFVVATLWVDKTLMLLGFMVPLFGWLPVVAPVWVYPALLVVSGSMLVPPLVATFAGRTSILLRPAIAGAGLVVCLAVTGVLAYTSPAYTSDRPLRRLARYVQDNLRHQAWWEIAGSEPALDLGPPGSLPGAANWPGPPGLGPGDANWQRVDDPPPASVDLWRLDARFRFRIPAPRLFATRPPVDVQSSLRQEKDGRLVLEVAVARDDYLAVQIVLPPGVRPISSSLAGRVTGGRWNATYVAPPSTGPTARLTFDGVSPSEFRQAAVVLTVPGLPDGAGRFGLPAWLPQDGTTWRARSQFIVGLYPH